MDGKLLSFLSVTSFQALSECCFMQVSELQGAPMEEPQEKWPTAGHAPGLYCECGYLASFSQECWTSLTGSERSLLCSNKKTVQPRPRNNYFKKHIQSDI